MKPNLYRAAIAMLLLLTALLWQQPAQAQTNVRGDWKILSTEMPINPVHAALMRTGKVLVVSGSGNVAGNLKYEAGVWDPETDAVTTQPLTWDMFCNGMVVLPDGRPFVISGTLAYDPFRGTPQTAAYDPESKQFVDLENMAHGRWYPTATTLADGKVMVFSGLSETGPTNTTVEIYSPHSGWSQEYQSGWVPPLYPRMHLLPNGNVFYSGPTRASTTFNTTTKTWSPTATTNYGGSRSYGTSVLLPLRPANGYRPRVMIFGGGNPATATTEIIDLSSTTPSWQYGPSMSQPRVQMNAVILPDGKVLAVGGSKNDEDASTASLNGDLFDPEAGTMSTLAQNAYPRLYHSVALLLPDGRVWLAGGNPARGTYEAHTEIYSPPYLFLGDGSPAPRPAITDAPGVIGYGSTFQVQTGSAAEVASVVLVRPGAVTHAFDMDQRLVGLSFTATNGALSVTGPPDGGVAPPGYYMLFLVNSSGVPSVASMVKVSSSAAQPDFTLSASPAAQVVLAGATTSYAVTVSGNSQFNGTVNMEVSGLPAGTTGTFNPGSITRSGSTTLVINTTSAAPLGNYELTITGTSGAITRSTKVSLIVVGTPPL